MRNIARLTQGHVVLITAVPLGAGRFEARCAGHLIVASTREPLLDGSRALLAAGHDPDTIAVRASTSTSGPHPQGRKGQSFAPISKKPEFQKIGSGVIFVEAITRSHKAPAVRGSKNSRTTPHQTTRAAAMIVNSGQPVFKVEHMAYFLRSRGL